MQPTEVTRLPYPAPGTTRGMDFHYEGCGCGELSRPFCGHKADWIWHKDNMERVSALVRGTEMPKLRIAYFIPHHNVTGGMKMIIQQIGQLKLRGHWVQAVFRGPAGSPVLPPWADVSVDSELLLAPRESVAPVLEHVDILLIGYFTQLLEFVGIEEFPGPIVCWDQGHEHVFGDPAAAPDWDRVFHQTMHLPLVFLSVSNVIRDMFFYNFARIAPVVPNAIDCSVFRPDAGARHAAIHPAHVRTKRILLVGNPALPLKNHEVALRALNHVAAWTHHGIEVTWICQHELPAHYADGFDAFLFPSLYEAWGMPVLEAMASGIPVVTSQCHGVDMFCQHGKNCLMVPPTHEMAMAQAVYDVLKHPELGEALAAEGRRTAEHFTWERSMEKLEDALAHVHFQLGNGRPCANAEREACGVPTPVMAHEFVDCFVMNGQIFAPGVVSVNLPPTLAELVDCEGAWAWDHALTNDPLRADHCPLPWNSHTGYADETGYASVGFEPWSRTALGKRRVLGDTEWPLRAKRSAASFQVADRSFYDFPLSMHGSADHGATTT